MHNQGHRYLSTVDINDALVLVPSVHDGHLLYIFIQLDTLALSVLGVPLTVADSETSLLLRTAIAVEELFGFCVFSVFIAAAEVIQKTLKHSFNTILT